MPDKWEKYVVSAQTPAPADKWAQYAQPSLPAGAAAALPEGAQALPGVPTPNRNLNYVPAIDSPANLLSGAWGGIKSMVASPRQTISGMGQPFVASGMAPGGMYPATAPMGLGDTGKTSLRYNTQVQGAAQEQQGQQGLYAASHPMETTGNVVGPALLTAGLAKALPKVGVPLEYVGGKMQEAGTGVINRTVGSLQRDFRRGANPGQAYLEAGGGPAISMESLARKGAALKGKVGSQIGTAVDEATSQGMQIPASNVSAAINPPIQNARAVISGPGGTGNLAPINAFEASFDPSLNPGGTNTGSPAMLTPRDVFEMKKNVAANTNWSDPTQFGMKNLQQQTTGALGGVLADAVPELRTLNPQYQGLTNFARRANLRAQTGSSPLTHLATKTTLGAGGALLGATHSPLAAALMGAGGIALDSVPVKTAAGSSLYYGGRGLVRMGKGMQGLYGRP